MTYQSHKKNWLLGLGLISLILGLIALYISQNFLIIESVKPSSQLSRIPYAILILVAVIIAPILEEITFRGFLIKNIIIKWFSIIVITTLSVLSNNIALKILLIVYIISLLYNNSKKNKFSLNILIILNALVFSLVHLNNDYLNNIEFIFAPLFIRFAMGIFLVWITINFNIIKSMFFHALWNFVPLILLSYSLFFPNTEVNYFENNDLQVTWSRVSKSSSKVNIYPFGKKNAIFSKSSEALFLLKSLEWTKNKNNSIYSYKPTEPYMNYKFDIKLKDTLNKNLYLKVENFLIESKLIKKN